MTIEVEAFKLEDRAREVAHKMLDRWIEMVEHEADDAYEDGRSGYLGRFELRACVDDDGISLRVERSLSEAI